MFERWREFWGRKSRINLLEGKVRKKHSETERLFTLLGHSRGTFLSILSRPELEDAIKKLVEERDMLNEEWMDLMGRMNSAQSRASLYDEWMEMPDFYLPGECHKCGGKKWGLDLHQGTIDFLLVTCEKCGDDFKMKTKDN